MAPGSCTVAVEQTERSVIIQFQDNQVCKIYVHPDQGIVAQFGQRSWSDRVGVESTLHQNQYKARESIRAFCRELRANRENWADYNVDTIMVSIQEHIGIKDTLWTSVGKWVSRSLWDWISDLTPPFARRALGYGPVGAIEWKQ